MKNVFGEFSHLWPKSNHASLNSLLSNLQVLYYPEEKSLIYFISDISRVIIVINKATTQEIVFLINKGFEHIVQKNRNDFAQELLVSCLMSVKPQSFVKNPIPFFFSGFQDPQLNSENLENNLKISLYSSYKKSAVIEQFHQFLNSRHQLQSVADIALQIADELVTNAIYSNSENKNSPKAEILFSKEGPVTFFCCYANHRIIVGCEDPHGTFNRRTFLNYLRFVFNEEKTKPNQDLYAGAGLGFRCLIENSANTYLFCVEGKKSLVACGLDTLSLRSNLSPIKNLHFSFMA